MAKKFRAGLAFTAGITGGTVMTIIHAVFRGLDVSSINLEMALGSMVTVTTGNGTWLLGFVMHLVISGLLALLYARVFDYWRTAGWLRGTLVAVPHIILAGFFVWILPAVHPAIPEVPGLAEPGFMYVNFGSGSVFVFLLGHLVYGAVVGGIYQKKFATYRS